MAKGKYLEWVTEEGLLKIEGWARDGLTDEQIAHNIGIRRETLYAWKKKYPNISNALKTGKEVVDRQVENALHKSAVGGTYSEKIYKVVDREPSIVEVEKRKYQHRYAMDNPEASQQEIEDAATMAIPTKEKILLQIIEKEHAPNPSAGIFWLKNRKPLDWRDKNETELSGGIGIENQFEDMTIEELEELNKKYGDITSKQK